MTTGSNVSPPKLLGGSANKTFGGIVNVPLPADTRHLKDAPLLKVLSVALYPVIRITPVGEPPDQVTGRPLVRVTEMGDGASG